MTWIALKMLTANASRYLSMIAGMAIAAFLIAQQCSVFCGVVLQTASEIRDVEDAEIWVMDPNVRFVDDVLGVPERQLFRIRGVEGVDWAVPRSDLLAEAKSENGNVHRMIVYGVADASLVGAPRQMIAGSLAALSAPDALIIDEAGYRMFWPGEPLRVGKQLELNDRRAVVVGICRTLPTFRIYPAAYTRYCCTKVLVPGSRKPMNYVLARAIPGWSVPDICRRIERQTGMRALTKQQFIWRTMEHYLRNTMIVANFALSTLLVFLFGLSMAGVTFYLFTTENLTHFGVLKAIGVSDRCLVGMILTQSVLVGGIGYGTGVGFAVLCGELMRRVTRLAFYMPYQVLAATALAMLLVVAMVSLFSICRVLRVEAGLLMRK